MKNAKKSNVLLIKNLPPDLSHEEKKSLLTCFGATSVRVMPSHGRLKKAAFATFADAEHANEALNRLHQLEVLDYVLSAEFASSLSKDVEVLLPDGNDAASNVKSNSEKADSQKNTSCNCTRKLPSISSTLGLNYSSNPACTYQYPPPNSDILLNICGALLTVPKFYTQVLHLMNKMNLYAPFSVNTFIPPVLIEHFYKNVGMPQQVYPNTSQDIPASPCYDTSEESELEEVEEAKQTLDVMPPERVAKALKRKKKLLRNSPKRKIARIKLDNSAVSESKLSHPKTDILEVFEPRRSDPSKSRISLSVPQKILPNTRSTDSNAGGDEANDVNVAQPLVETEGNAGFGKIIPVDKSQNDHGSDEVADYIITKDFITEQQLAAGRLSSKELSTYSAFKHYNPGQPSCRLYVKNLSKKATDKDVQRIFGLFVDFDNDDEARMFDVRVMTQGRMRGQAFVGLPSVAAAAKAVKLVNGYKLIDKPIVVTFARSAKHKNTDQS